MSDELAELKRKVAELEAQQLKRKIAELEAKQPQKEVAKRGSNRGLWFLVIVVILFFMGVFNNDPQKATTAVPAKTAVPASGSVNQKVVAGLLPIVPKCKSAVQQYQKAGIVGDVRNIGAGMIIVEFDE